MAARQNKKRKKSNRVVRKDTKVITAVVMAALVQAGPEYIRTIGDIVAELVTHFS